MTEPTQVQTSDDRQLVMTTLVQAPLDLVFRVFTEPEHVEHWWGPFGFRNSIDEMSVEPGGVWRFVMHGPDGTDYPNLIQFREVVRNERLTFRHGSGVAGGEPDFDVEIRFESEAGGTRVTLCQTHVSAARAREVAKYAVEGGKQTFTRLSGYLGAMRETNPTVLEGADPDGSADFVLTRVFAAPRKLLFEAMTEPGHLEKWFGPPGVPTRVVTSELHAGGTLRYAMGAGDRQAFGRAVYREVAAPERLAYVVSFTDADGQPVRHPASATWPLEVLSIFTLTELGGKTLLMGRAIPIHASPTDRNTFKAGHAGMVQGWKGAYDLLDAYLQKLTG